MRVVHTLDGFTICEHVPDDWADDSPEPLTDRESYAHIISEPNPESLTITYTQPYGLTARLW